MQEPQGSRTIHLDAVGGVAGDMFVAAMVDALPWLRTRVLADVTAVLGTGRGVASFREGRSGALRALRFGLDTGDSRPAAGAGGVDDGSFSAMSERIVGSGVDAEAARHAVSILRILAEAEARIHNVPVSDVHFHEIGDWDSLADVAAAGSIAAALEGATWTVSALPRGSGMVRTQHGLLPVPAPATCEILAGFSWRDDGIGGERVTPTGAAILRHLGAARAAAGASGRLAATGYGAGTRELDGVPNVLRAMVFDAMVRETKAGVDADTVCVVSFEVDDMTGEEIGVAADRLRALPGLLDLSIATRFGKKSRPMQSFRLLTEPHSAAGIAERCLIETSTIGLRLHEERRMVLRREHGVADGKRVKTAIRPDGVRTAKAESDDLTGESLAARRQARWQVERDKGG